MTGYVDVVVATGEVVDMVDVLVDEVLVVVVLDALAGKIIPMQTKTNVKTTSERLRPRQPRASDPISFDKCAVGRRLRDGPYRCGSISLTREVGKNFYISG